MQLTIAAGTLLVALSSFIAVAIADPCTGAYFTDLIPAPANCSRFTQKNDTVTVDYKGYFPNGTVFDQSYNSTDGPYDGTCPLFCELET
jgi:FKBP-type peptidyl-prolyl cis-trans isomerase